MYTCIVWTSKPKVGFEVHTIHESLVHLPYGLKVIKLTVDEVPIF